MSELVATRIREHAERLHLANLTSNLDALVTRAEQATMGYLDFLDLLLEEEVGVREGRRFHNALKLSGLPHHKGLDGFDFAFQPDLDARKVRDLAALGFAQAKANVCFLGPPGVGKTMLAVALAKQGHVGGETVLEGDAGFYHAYAGNNRGQLTYSFVGDTRTSLDRITAALGKEWLFLETILRIYHTAGYNIAHVDVTAKLCEEHDIGYKDVDRVEAVVNWLETQYPSPAFPSRREDLESKPGSTSYYTAYGVVKRGFPVLKAQVDPSGAGDPPEVLDLMKRVTLIPSHRMTLFGPRITIYTKDGKSYTKQSTGREFIWDFDEEARRIRGVVPGLPIPAAQFEDIIATCRDLDRQDRADRLIGLTLKKA